MAEEDVHYASEVGTNKRKYEEEQTISRKPTGFSAPISSQSPDASYNTVPPPMDDFQLAKQKAQEIAARLLNTAEPKKARVDNGSGFDSVEHKPFVNPAVTNSYGYPGPSKKIEVPNARVGVIIGRGGETIKYLQLQSGAKIQVTRDMDSDPHSRTRGVELVGTPEQIAKAEQLISDVLSEADAGGSGIVSRRITGQVAGAEQFVMKVANNKVGLIIGKGGETIKNMQARTGARIQVIPLHLPPGDTSTERTVQIDGSTEQIEAAKQLVYEVTSENRVRNPGMAGGYPQQGYQTQPPASWAPPGAQMQQPGYGYLQPGAYPGPSPQYNTSQPPYPGYPPQQASGGYASGWDQTTAPNQQTSQAGGAGGYDYYSQQAPPQQQQTPGGSAASTDTTAYGYNQPSATGYNQGQSYSQDGYGGYHAPAAHSGYQGTGYDQQQGYSSTPSYGNVPNPTSDGHNTSHGTQGDGSQAPAPAQSSAVGQQGYQSGQQPSPTPSYPSQGSTQAGYGMPPTSQGVYGTQSAAGYGPPQAQKPPTSHPAYGQPQQSPSAQGGYAQPPPVQPGYPQAATAQSGYGQGDSGTQRPPSSYGTPTAHPGYGAASYGQQPPPYSSAYAGGYVQPPAAYSSDGNGVANPTSQSVQPSTGGVPKASPQS
ncbi:far upstream element-binding protein 2 [Solanum tuberosum]|uniref:F17H15.1/F17H15.1 n=2 Tax=Solanum tuberosum TaxID=4113 RepID=M0ZQ75_SOLTU|nr:PREDICTED: far upstream element-binding protein 2 [Solanum tuberosum]